MRRPSRGSRRSYRRTRKRGSWAYAGFLHGANQDPELTYKRGTQDGNVDGPTRQTWTGNTAGTKIHANGLWIPGKAYDVDSPPGSQLAYRVDRPAVVKRIIGRFSGAADPAGSGIGSGAYIEHAVYVADTGRPAPGALRYEALDDVRVLWESMQYWWSDDSGVGFGVAQHGGFDIKTNVRLGERQTIYCITSVGFTGTATSFHLAFNVDAKAYVVPS